MGTIEDLYSQAITPVDSSQTASPLQMLSLVAQLKNMQGAGSQTSGPRTVSIGQQPLLNMSQYQNWARQYGQSGVPESALVPLVRGNYPATDDALWVRPDLAAAFRAASQAYHAQTGDWLRSALVSAWRPFQSSSPKATSMRNSDHWLAGAIDLAANSGADLWLRQHGAAFGFDPQYSGFNWGDPGHFSFGAGGFYGSASASGARWGIPTQADARWLALARQLFG